MLRLLALVCAATLSTVTLVRADDAGDLGSVAAIRHDLPTLLAASTKEPVIESVVVNGDSALAQWRDGDVEWLGVLNRRYERWWLIHTIRVQSDGSVFCCGGAYSSGDQYGPQAVFLERIGVAPALADAARLHLPLVANAERRFAAACASGSVCPLEHGDGYAIDAVSFARTTELVPQPLYGVTVSFATNDAGADDRIDPFRVRAPTLAESWLTPGGNAYAFFSGVIVAAHPIHVQQGSQIDVWFPFALQPSLRYSLTIAPTRGTAIGPIPGALAQNTLHFRLPAFTLEAGAELMAEIDGN